MVGFIWRGKHRTDVGSIKIIRPKEPARACLKKITFFKSKLPRTIFFWWEKCEILVGIITVLDLVQLGDCGNIGVNVGEWVTAAFDAT